MLRKNSNGPLWGVCEGLGDWSGIDPVLIRLGFCCMTLFTEGSGVLLYFILAICMRESK